MLGNGIGAEGAKGLCEMLKVNKTLTLLDLEGEPERKNKMKKRKKDESQMIRLEMKEQKQ